MLSLLSLPLVFCSFLPSDTLLTKEDIAPSSQPAQHPTEDSAENNANSLIQTLAEDDPELAEVMKDPVRLVQWLNSTEGEGTLEKMAEGMQDVLNDPVKMKALLEEFETDPLFSDLQEKMPELAAEIKKAIEHMEL